ncbi:MAG: hypothetical protein RMJ88_07115 [Thermogemmata sp.]|nr:hypothetical protein [Thermogemmata sp.]
MTHPSAQQQPWSVQPSGEPVHSIGAVTDDPAATPPEPASPLDTDPTTPVALTQLGRLIREEPQLRLWLLTGIGALILQAFYFLMQASDTAALLILVIGTAGWILRWSSAAYWILLLNTWFHYFPDGVPGGSRPNYWLLNKYGNPESMLAILSLVTYIWSHWQWISLTREVAVVPRPDGTVQRWRRPAHTLQPAEWYALWVFSLLALGITWLLWMIVDGVVIVPGSITPLDWQLPPLRLPSDALAPWLTRLIVLTSLITVILLGYRLVALMRLRYTWKASDAAFWLHDLAWQELHREWRRQATLQQRHVSPRQENRRPPYPSA